MLCAIPDARKPMAASRCSLKSSISIRLGALAQLNLIADVARDYLKIRLILQHHTAYGNLRCARLAPFVKKATLS